GFFVCTNDETRGDTMKREIEYRGFRARKSRFGGFEPQEYEWKILRTEEEWRRAVDTYLREREEDLKFESDLLLNDFSFPKNHPPRAACLLCGATVEWGGRGNMTAYAKVHRETCGSRWVDA